LEIFSHTAKFWILPVVKIQNFLIRILPVAKFKIFFMGKSWQNFKLCLHFHTAINLEISTRESPSQIYHLD
jgi:hypothetical protein